MTLFARRQIKSQSSSLKVGSSTVAKIAFRPAYLRVSEARGRFRNDAELVEALREGTLTARGRLTSDFTIGANGGSFNTPTEPSYGEPELIPISAWREWDANLQADQLTDGRHHSQYTDVEIPTGDFDALVLPATGGRPEEHDWELILKQAMVWISQHPISKTATLDGWIKDLAVSLPYCVENDVPKEDALKRKLRDVFRAISKGQPLPVGKPRRARG